MIRQPLKSSLKSGVVASAIVLGTLLPATPLVAQPPQGAFGFNGTVSGFPTGVVSLTGGGAFELTSTPETNFVHSAGGFGCLADVKQGPLSVALHEPFGNCLAGQGVRWDTAALLDRTTFKCTGAQTEQLKTATTSDTTVVLMADFYRAGDANDESFRAKMIVSATDIAPNDISGLQNLWVEGVGCGTAIVHFSNK
jgi:hypothetical protein